MGINTVRFGMAEREAGQKHANWRIRRRIQILCGADPREKGVRGVGGEGLPCLQSHPPRPLTTPACTHTAPLPEEGREGEGRR